MKKLISAALGLIAFASASIVNAASIAPGTYLLQNHPDGNQAPPEYGLRLDGLTGSGVYTFDFNSGNMTLTWDDLAGTIHISGTAVGNQDGEIWTVDFTYDTGITQVANGGADDIVVDSTGHHVNFGTLSSSTHGNFDLRAHGKNNGAGNTFIFGDEGGAGHRGFAGLSGWGWLDYRTSESIDSMTPAGAWIGSDTSLTSDWLFTAVPVPAAVWLFGSGLIGLVGFARRKA